MKLLNYTKNHFLLLIVILFLVSCSPQPNLEVPKEFKRGQDYFHKVCSNCHGPDALGKHTKAPRLIDEEYILGNFSDDDIRSTVIDGSGKMPSQRRKVTDEEISEIIKYLRYSQKTAGLEITPEEEEEEEEEEE
jgi:mono/diheme cytochrome c family protein